MEIYYIIYRITNKINGKVYIGSHKTRNLEDGYMGSGKYLNRSINTHGLENFSKEILFMYDNSTDMYRKESEIVDEDFLSEENTYNIKLGGFGGWDHCNKSKLNIRTGDSNFFYGNTEAAINANNAREALYIMLPEKKKEHYAKSAESVRKYYHTHPGTFAGKKHTDDTKRRIGEKNSKIQSGSGNSQYGTRWIHSSVEKKSKRISKYAPLPEGWAEGRKMKF